MALTFKAEQHLKSKADILRLVEKGDVVFSYPVKLYYIRNDMASVSRFAVSVPKKNFKRAVLRNLLKRRMREAIRLNHQACLGDIKGDFLFVYLAKEVADFNQIEKKLRFSLEQSAKK